MSPDTDTDTDTQKSKICAEALDKVMEAIGSFIDEKIKSEVTYKDHPYYGGQVYEAEKELRSALLDLLDNRDFE
jgi:RNA binding exosome subunit